MFKKLSLAIAIGSIWLAGLVEAQPDIPPAIGINIHTAFVTNVDDGIRACAYSSGMGFTPGFFTAKALLVDEFTLDAGFNWLLGDCMTLPGEICSDGDPPYCFARGGATFRAVEAIAGALVERDRETLLLPANRSASFDSSSIEIFDTIAGPQLVLKYKLRAQNNHPEIPCVAIVSIFNFNTFEWVEIEYPVMASSTHLYDRWANFPNPHEFDFNGNYLVRLELVCDDAGTVDTQFDVVGLDTGFGTGN